MIVLNHGASFSVADDMELVRERVHPATMAAEGPLHELGAIGIVNSDSQGMGRMMETVRRTFQLAHVMRAWRTTEAGRGHAGCRTTPTTPSIRRRGSCATWQRSRSSRRSPTASPSTSGRWRRAAWPTSSCGSRPIFGVKPEFVFKSGFAAWAPLGEGNASVERAEPTRYQPDWGGSGGAPASLSLTFVSARGAADPRLVRRLAAGGRSVMAVQGTRGLTRADLAHNRATAPIEIDPVDGLVTLAGRPLEVEPVTELPLNRRYWLR
jgi:urease subunit alpha